eukprot:756115-Pyramimonas_sp.AAC.1
MGFRYPLRSGGASLEGWKRHETMKIIWVSNALLAQAGPPWRGGRSGKPCNLYSFPMPSSLMQGLHGEVGRARNHVNSTGSRYPPRSGGASLEGMEGHGTM